MTDDVAGMYFKVVTRFQGQITASYVTAKSKTQARRCLGGTIVKIEGPLTTEEMRKDFRQAPPRREGPSGKAAIWDA